MMRIHSIDIAKGIGIILVILGHLIINYDNMIFGGGFIIGYTVFTWHRFSLSAGFSLLILTRGAAKRIGKVISHILYGVYTNSASRFLHLEQCFAFMIVSATARDLAVLSNQ